MAIKPKKIRPVVACESEKIGIFAENIESMPNASQILALIKSHVEADDVRFREIALQMAASEAKSGHVVLSRNITDLINCSKTPRFVAKCFTALNSDVSEYVMGVDDSFGMDNIVCPDKVRNKLNRIIREYKQRDLLYKNNLTNRRKILLAGPSGTGKTMTASILANELHIPLFVVRMERVITKYMGESSLKLAKVFELISNVRGVYLFDEFDAIGMQRGQDNEVGEMRRILNTFLQLIERMDSDSLIVAATNCGSQLDKALFRRFDDVIEYSLPGEQEIEVLLSHCLYGFDSSKIDCHNLLPLFKGMSHAEITSVCMDAVKESLLGDVPLDNSVMESAIQQKNSTVKMIG